MSNHWKESTVIETRTNDVAVASTESRFKGRTRRLSVWALGLKLKSSLHLLTWARRRRPARTRRAPPRPSESGVVYFLLRTWISINIARRTRSWYLRFLICRIRLLEFYALFVRSILWSLAFGKLNKVTKVDLLLVKIDKYLINIASMYILKK